MDVRVTDLLYQAQIKEFDEHFERVRSSRVPVVWVSALVLCPMKWRLMLRYPEIARACFRGSFVLGKLAHVGLQRFLMECATMLGFEWIECEVPVEKSVALSDGSVAIVSGRIDALARKNGERIVIEFKTARSDRGLPHQHHVEQLRIYMNMVNASRGILLYVTPDRVAEYEYDEPMNNEELAQLVESFIKAEKAPRFDWECNYCLYAPLCPRKIVNTRCNPL